MVKYIFILVFVFYTEGVNGQENLGRKPDFDAPNDSTENIKSVDAEYQSANANQVSPYAAAREQYERKPIEPKTADKNKWAEATKGIDYSDDKVKPRKQNEPSNFNPNWLVLVELLKWFFIIGAIGLIAFLILRFVGEGNIFGMKARRLATPSVEIDLEHIEEHLDKTELDPLIQKAIDEKNYALAVRLYYLAILKELNASGAIQWKKDKTNRAYLREMREHIFQAPFRSVTSIFERVWYGSQVMDALTFQKIQANFQSLLRDTRAK